MQQAPTLPVSSASVDQQTTLEGRLPSDIGPPPAVDSLVDEEFTPTPRFVSKRVEAGPKISTPILPPTQRPELQPQLRPIAEPEWAKKNLGSYAPARDLSHAKSAQSRWGAVVVAGVVALTVLIAYLLFNM